MSQNRTRIQTQQRKPSVTTSKREQKTPSTPNKTLTSRRVSTTPQRTPTTQKSTTTSTTTTGKSRRESILSPTRRTTPIVKNTPNRQIKQQQQPKTVETKQQNHTKEEKKIEKEEENELIQLDNGVEEFFKTDLDSFIEETEEKNKKGGINRIIWSSDEEEDEFLNSPLPSNTPSIKTDKDDEDEENENQNQNSDDQASEQRNLDHESEIDEDNNSIYSDNGFSYVRDMLHLKGELKSKNYQLKGLIQETSRLEKNLSKKEKSLFELNAELHKTNERVLCLEQDLQLKEQENESLKEELEKLKEENQQKQQKSQFNQSRRISIPKKNKQNETIMQKLQSQYQDARSVAVATHSLDSLPEELYKHVLSLDNQLNVIDRKYQQTQKENQDLKVRNKELENYYQKTTKQIQTLKKQSKEQILTLKQTYSTQIAQFSAREEKHKKQLKNLKSNEHIKSKRILELEEIEKQFQSIEKQISIKENEKRSRDRKILSLQKQIKHLQHESSLKDNQLTKANDSNKVFPVKMWEQDRKLIQGKMEQMKNTLASKDRTIQAQKKRILELCDRVDLIASSLQEMDPDSARQIDIAAQINGTSFKSSSIHNNRSFSSSSPILETSLRSDNKILPQKISIIEDDGIEEELTDDLLNFDENSVHDQTNHQISSFSFDNSSEQGEKGSDNIPIKLYKLLEFEVQKLKSQIFNLEDIIKQKDEAISVRILIFFNQKLFFIYFFSFF